MTDYTQLKRLATRIVEVQTSQDVPISKLFDDFEAAACPETILALIAENERLEEINHQMILLECNGGTAQAAINLLDERDRLRAEVAGLRTGYEAYEQVNAELKAENEALRKDVERYQWLRLADWWRSPICVIRHPKEQAKLGSDCPTGERLDSAIDAAMGQGEQS